MFEVHVDVSQIVNVAVQLDQVGKRTRAAINAALNRAGAQASTVVKRELAKATGVKQQDLGLVQRKAYPGNSEFVLSVESATTPLSAFAARQTQRGVTATAWGHRKLYSGTFLATMHSGHEGVYAHEFGAPRYTRRISPTSGRSYWLQTNIKQLWGPSVAKEMMKDPIPQDFEKKAVEVFEPRLTHELERMIAAIDPTSKLGSVPNPQV